MIYFHHKHRCCFQVEMWRRFGRTDRRTDRRTDTPPPISAVFFLPKTVTVTMLLLFGHVALLCGKFLFIYLSKGPVEVIRLSDWRPLDMRSRLIHSTLVQFASNAPLILPPEADQHQSKISPLTASETFTQRRRWRIAAGSLHPNGNGACLTEFPTLLKIKITIL